jgi:hypothetical protein
LIALLAGGMFGAVWNTADNLAPPRHPAAARPCPVNPPGRAAESAGAEDPTFAARAPADPGRALAVRAAGGAS